MPYRVKNKPRMPAFKLIAKFGSAYALARAIGVAPSTTLRWTYPVDKGGLGGRVPQAHFDAIIAAGKRLGIRLGRDDLYEIKPLNSRGRPRKWN